MAEIWIRKYKDGTTIQMCFKIKIFETYELKLSSPISAMPLPQEGGQENILVKMEGNTHTANLTWVLKNETVNQGVSNETLGGGSTTETKTIFDVMRWFEEADSGFIGQDVGDNYDILILEDPTFPSGTGTYNMALTQINETVGSTTYAEFIDPQTEDNGTREWTGVREHLKGFIRNVSFRAGKDAPATLTANIELIVGTEVMSYQGATPNNVTNFRARQAVDAADRDTIRLTWRAPRHTGVSGISTYLVAFKKVSASKWEWEKIGNGLATDVELTGLDASSDYGFKVVPFNNQGRGGESAVRYFSTTATP